MAQSSDISIGQLQAVSQEDALYVVSLMRTIPDFPKQGILFRDFLPALADPRGLKVLAEALVKTLPVAASDFDLVAGLEARGFLLGPQLAMSLGKGFLALRKKGKLPPPTLSQEYSLEYGNATIEMEKGSIVPGQKVLIVDDLIATGGSAKAAADLIKRAGGQVAGFSFIMELEGLAGRRELQDYPVTTLVSMPA
ncbi:adenine phosphoribosyltransferase [Bifidobacterium actinocoloniiforme DSM 22766]|uniref:Adenine phosphoribosyltransferase n=1 Tax=Bifidobacterium actinocoloniiforme DSM 22766 TaxID=1437605 RepID=A0A086Z0G8_9BIFI|nr:adenine phosphoribosyltransferase [Bifidobacterium actinocoloniiforme]AKV55245.1 adenine phosphoribosyltransferase [Bifidobacterium actinocoloniiforme DSM 22766]KFI40018.1 adenine phosphoribosyltransferase [Bifidobacterium actinocoloniiforme DSM 22766]